MAPLDIVVAQKAIQIALDLLDAYVPSLSALHGEEFIEQCSSHALGEAVGVGFGSWLFDA